MRKVIDGKVYDTKTATNIAIWEPNPDTGNFHYICETLCRTRKGKYFVHGCGHGFTKWAWSDGRNSGMGEGIEPLTDDEALHWCEKRGVSADIIEELFKISEA